MKRSSELTSLSHEHHHSLRLAKNCLDTAATGDEAKCITLCQHILDIFDQEWDRHFRNEEASIFDITATMTGKINELGIQLVNEHQRMRTMVAEMQPGDCKKLAEFGELLRDHTRLEERELFPLVEVQFSSQQLQRIKDLT
ncbi:MAG TPA: hemerythrin domain-containing protein [Thiolapillus brandeum]|uniref:Hemerythrin domain-containing protein n=1 Tax=Thiolapillus brandeum TaxID=1076588 RepID=A0A831K343_9GAMM|nr:hemerythrin domain-containing protein [Thiolapillus brandeum]